MADVFSKEKRSAIMASIRGKHTAPEKALKRVLRAKRVRYRSHVKALRGTPDIVLPDLRVVVFINGCFWHGHKGCRRSKLPATNAEFWTKKISGNVKRDRAQQRELRHLGWKVRIFWTCRKASAFASTLK